MKSCAYPAPSIDTSSYMDYPPIFSRKILSPAPILFFKTLNSPINKGAGSHYECCKTCIAGGLMDYWGI